MRLKITKRDFFLFLMGIIVASFSITKAASYLASSVEYVPADTSWAVNNVQSAVDELHECSVSLRPPVGEIIAYMGTTAPNWYLECNGSVYNISDFPQLAEHIKTQFGSYNKFGGNGTTTFAVPDLRGEFLRGTGTNSHTNSVTNLLEGSGSNVGVHQEATADIAISTYQSNANRHYTAYNFTDNNSRNYDSLSFVSNYKYFANGGTNTQQGQQIGNYYTSRPTNTSVMYAIRYE